MSAADRFPLDLDRAPYTYVERPNSVILDLCRKHVLRAKPSARLLDVGCGAGANARALKAEFPSVHITGIEPNPRAAELARVACDEVFCGVLDAWIAAARKDEPPFDAIVLSDVLEHIADPVRFLQTLTQFDPLRGATWVVSVPNYAVWYNRLRTLGGRFEYAWSGLYDRTHLRFFTRRSIRELLAYCGLRVVDDSVSPSLVQSWAPILRRFFDEDVARGDHLALTDTGAYRVYDKYVEPAERVLCKLWPEMLGFQVVVVARAA